jgi:hypothetical protein
MDDFNQSTLHESKNEWGIYLLNVLSPVVMEGFQSILAEAVKSCRAQKEDAKYLLVFQNYVEKIPKWNQTTIDEESRRIVKRSKCDYLEELIACVHIIQLKILTAVRTSYVQKKMDIEIPKLDRFVHRVYINVARKAYRNAYLFARGIPKLQSQKNQRDFELIVRECILNTIRDSMPIETILKVYVDDTATEVSEEFRADDPPAASSSGGGEDAGGASPPVPPLASSSSTAPAPGDSEYPHIAAATAGVPVDSIKFNDVDSVLDMGHGTTSAVSAPKTIDRLEEIGHARHMARKADEADDYDSEDESGVGGGGIGALRISDDIVPISADSLDAPDSSAAPPMSEPIDIMDDIEVLH